MEHEHPFQWRRRTAPVEGLTRTRDKYRVVYTEKQRTGLEHAFEENKFIALQTKLELAKELDLSERQIKLWFQNRRAKERRDLKKSNVTKTAGGSSSTKDKTSSNTSLNYKTPLLNYTDCQFQGKVAVGNFQATLPCFESMTTKPQRDTIMANDSSPHSLNESTMFPNPWKFGESRDWSPYLDVSPIGGNISQRW
ncbi:homeobox protein CDX-4-like [Mya arenaria]|uniref:homeobox protein CDX-4-like n=1 Tax=Mya arenaria TaxID=6604 RepID=UPI0022E5AD8B|nr:homeobox protein CDX-4-like [Mya arenaria]